MPDISLLPALAEALGVTIDELFDLTVDQRLRRIERRIDVEEELSADVFQDYAEFLTQQLTENQDRTRILSLLAHLYHHRMEADARRVSRYAREAIRRNPEKKDCQWLLQKAEGKSIWDWNIGNQTAVIDFYRKVIAADTVSPHSPMPYYEIMDSLITDHRTKEALAYLERYQALPAHKPFLVPVYRANIALADYDAVLADQIMEEAAVTFSEHSGFLFEAAQYYVRRGDYVRAIQYYERSWALDERRKPRFTDPLHGIALVYEILGETDKALEAYDRMIRCIKEEWGYADEDAAVIEVQREKRRLLGELL
ncbi:MAG: hypothetical protein E7618_08220 [Ruminococcaceae bacterium]|nr:hypothetical protein [Oscillospiraceae bacterium]